MENESFKKMVEESLTKAYSQFEEITLLCVKKPEEPLERLVGVHIHWITKEGFLLAHSKDGHVHFFNKNDVSTIITL